MADQWRTDVLRRHVHCSEYDPLVDEVELLQANRQFAHVHFPAGSEATVSIRDLAPRGQSVHDGATDDDGTSGFRCPGTVPGLDKAAPEQIKAVDVPYARYSHCETLPSEAPTQVSTPQSLHPYLSCPARLIYPAVHHSCAGLLNLSGLQSTSTFKFKLFSLSLSQ